MMGWFEEYGPPLERREEGQDSDFPLAMADEQNPELSILSPIGKQRVPAKYSAPTRCSGSRTVCVPERLRGGHEIRVRCPY